MGWAFLGWTVSLWSITIFVDGPAKEAQQKTRLYEHSRRIEESSLLPDFRRVFQIHKVGIFAQILNSGLLLALWFCENLCIIFCINCCYDPQNRNGSLLPIISFQICCYIGMFFWWCCSFCFWCTPFLHQYCPSTSSN